MCIIAIKPKNVEMFNDETLETMFRNNPDGSGFMYCDGKDVVIKKGFMTVEDLKKALKKNDLKSKTVVIHFRIGTSGYNDELNCHPFPIYQRNCTSCKTDIGMAHNGILHDYTPSKISDINDTQVFIQTVLRRLKKGFQKNKDVIELITELVGTNKLAFLDNTGSLTLVGDFIKDGKYIYSNTSYRPRKAKKSVSMRDLYTAYTQGDEEENWFWKDWDLRHSN